MALNLWTKVKTHLGRSLLTIACGIAIAVSTYYLTRSDPRPQLEVVDAYITTPKGLGPETINIKLVNRGAQPAFIKLVRFTILASRSLRPCISAVAVPSSYDYQIALPPDAKAGQAISARISQSVLAGAVDYFKVTLGTRGPAKLRVGSSMYQLSMALLYNTGQTHELRLDPFVVEAVYPLKSEGFVVLDPKSATGFACWKRVLDDQYAMLTLPGKRSAKLKKRLNVVERQRIQLASLKQK